jgi:NADH:ubiquinone oxidoreductase subunit E
MKTPTRSPTHQDVDVARLAALGLEVEDIADGDEVELTKLVELAEDRGRPPSHYLAAIPLATELRLATHGAATTVRICCGTCQRYGALDLLERLAEHHAGRVDLVLVGCLDRCDQAPACELRGAHGQLVLAPATVDALDEALRALG